MGQLTTPPHCTITVGVHYTAGADNAAQPQSPIFQGAVGMGFYNMAAGDAPYLKSLAGRYAISDNYHQAVQGGTGANHVALGTGPAAFYQDPTGNAAAPPACHIQNPTPQPPPN